MNDPDTNDEDNDGTWPDGTPVLTPFPVTDEEIAGGRAGWPWVAASILAQVGPDEWSVVIEDERATTPEDGTDEKLYPIVFRDAGEIRPAGDAP